MVKHEFIIPEIYVFDTAQFIISQLKETKKKKFPFMKLRKTGL